MIIGTVHTIPIQRLQNTSIFQHLKQFWLHNYLHTYVDNLRQEKDKFDQILSFYVRNIFNQFQVNKWMIMFMPDVTL